jgi:hypothetical protein
MSKLVPILFALAAFATGCGGSPKPPYEGYRPGYGRVYADEGPKPVVTPPAPAKRDEAKAPEADPFRPLIEACISGAPPAKRYYARRYCECFYREAKARWTYAYFSKNVARCEAELEKEVDEACFREATR